MASGPTVVVVQARLGSTRLPAKVLADLAGRPVLDRVLNRLARSDRIDEVVVATTWLPEDDALVDWCGRAGWTVDRGHPTDLLDRYLKSARAHHAAVVVRVTSDCPMIDPNLVDDVIAELQADARLDYCSNTLEPRTFPRGLDVEVFTVGALERSAHADRDPGTREHVTPHMKSAQGIHKRGVYNSEDLSAIRWTVDTPEDLEVVRRVYSAFDGDDAFTWHDALRVWTEHPDWHRINAHIQQKPVIAQLGENSAG
jgi:spore coat polysaccharide biosynthesis protein SpsF